MRNALIAMLSATVTIAVTAAQAPSPMTRRDPIEIAKLLAARYPAQPIMSYIPALSWSGQLRLSALTGDPQWRDKALAAMRPFVDGETPTIAEPYRLTSLAGALALFDANMLLDRGAPPAAIGFAHAYQVAAERVAYFILPGAAAGEVKFQTGWTDDMFMAGSLLARKRTPDAAQFLRKLLKAHAAKLQRADGLFIHAADAPHAWGRGNGFALLGVTEALMHLPEPWPPMDGSSATRAELLNIYHRHVAALAKHQSDDGSWRQVIDEPGSYRELTVTALTVASLARGIRRGWIDRGTYEPIMRRGWTAVTARVNSDGTVRDVCSGTGAGPTKEYYVNRPVVNGADDRGGAMALLAAIEVAELEAMVKQK